MFVVLTLKTVSSSFTRNISVKYISNLISLSYTTALNYDIFLCGVLGLLTNDGKWLSTVSICKKLVQIVYIIFYDKYFYFKNHLSKPNVIGGV